MKGGKRAGREKIVATRIPRGITEKFKQYREGKINERELLNWITVSLSFITEIKMPKELKLPHETYEVVRETFLRERIPKKQLQPVSPQQLQKFKFKEGKEVFFYGRQDSNGEVSYYLPKEIVDGVMPSFPFMRKAYIGSFIMALEQKSPNVRFTSKQKLERLGYSEERIKGGKKLFEKLLTSEKALAGIHFHYKNKKKGKEFVEIIGSYYSFLQRGAGKGAVYEVMLNPIFTQNIDFKTGEIKGRFIKIPLHYITSREMWHYERNIRTKALNFIDLSRLEIKGTTILEWAGVPKYLERRKKFRERIYLVASEVLQDMGFQRTKIDYNKKPEDFRKWKLTFTPPRIKRAGITLGEDEKAFIEKFTEWQSREVHYGKKGRKLSEEEVRAHITNTVRAYGLETCSKVFTQVDRLANPSPMEFWNRIKDLKKQKEAGDQTKNGAPLVQS